MNIPENARDASGHGNAGRFRRGPAQQERLAAWVRLLEDERVMENVIASYHVVPAAQRICAANQSAAVEECA